MKMVNSIIHRKICKGKLPEEIKNETKERKSKKNKYWKERKQKK